MSAVPLLALSPNWISVRYLSAMGGINMFTSNNARRLPAIASIVILR